MTDKKYADIISYWKGDGSNVTFCNKFFAVQDLHLKMTGCTSLDEWLVCEGEPTTIDKWDAFKSIVLEYDKRYKVPFGSFFICSNNQNVNNVKYMFAVCDKTAMRYLRVDNKKTPHFKLPKCKLWCCKCDIEPEPNDGENDDE